ncbi:MAG: ParB/RepB/Spo0J family partition protein [bacterium]|nr:ParB/RepB/Spo0J family partition protein [bacterium]MDE0600696.1 ParB/RepB/Spo0J family partition protein [bacterium]
MSALIPTGEPASASPYREIPINQIRPNPSQPRSRHDEETLRGLARSIIEVGLLQPVVVQETAGGYTLISGERRWRAAQLAGLQSIPAILRQADETGALTQALIENLQREDLTPLEEASAYRNLIDQHGLTQQEVAHRVGKGRATVANSIRLLRLPPPILELLETGQLTAGHARALLSVSDPKYATHIAKRAVAEGWTVRQVEEAVHARSPRKRTSRAARAPRPAQIVELETRLADQLGLPVSISYGNQKGSVKVGYNSIDDLQRVFAKLIAP